MPLRTTLVDDKSCMEKQHAQVFSTICSLESTVLFAWFLMFLDHTREFFSGFCLAKDVTFQFKFFCLDWWYKYASAEVASGEVEIQGGVYDLESGEVEFLGRCPSQDSLLKSGAALPPSLA